MWLRIIVRITSVRGMLKTVWSPTFMDQFCSSFPSDWLVSCSMAWPMFLSNVSRTSAVVLPCHGKYVAGSITSSS
jgi:hypothetical protein